MKTLLTFLFCSFMCFPTSAQKENKVYNINEMDSFPRFPGCENEPEHERSDCANKKLLQFVYSRLRYPVDAKKWKTEGVVVVQYVVDEEGFIVNPKIVQDIGDGCGEEVLRVIKEMPIWIPAMQNGTPVKARYTLPIKFRLD